MIGFHPGTRIINLDRFVAQSICGLFRVKVLDSVKLWLALRVIGEEIFVAGKDPGEEKS